MFLEHFTQTKLRAKRFGDSKILPGITDLLNIAMLKSCTILICIWDVSQDGNKTNIIANVDDQIVQQSKNNFTDLQGCK